MFYNHHQFDSKAVAEGFKYLATTFTAYVRQQAPIAAAATANYVRVQTPIVVAATAKFLQEAQTDLGKYLENEYGNKELVQLPPAVKAFLARPLPTPGYDDGALGETYLPAGMVTHYSAQEENIGDASILGHSGFKDYQAPPRRSSSRDQADSATCRLAGHTP